jgi:hypothetical protein
MEKTIEKIMQDYQDKFHILFRDQKEVRRIIKYVIAVRELPAQPELLEACKCNDLYRDAPKRNGARVVDEAYEIFKHRNKK